MEKNQKKKEKKEKRKEKKRKPDSIGRIERLMYISRLVCYII